MENFDATQEGRPTRSWMELWREAQEHTLQAAVTAKDLKVGPASKLCHPHDPETPLPQPLPPTPSTSTATHTPSTSSSSHVPTRPRPRGPLRATTRAATSTRDVQRRRRLAPKKLTFDAVETTQPNKQRRVEILTIPSDDEADFVNILC